MAEGPDNQEGPEVTAKMRRLGAIALDASRGCLDDEEAAEAIYTAMARARSDESAHGLEARQKANP